ncbi:hypothetical protein [Anabaena sp. CCY 9402-a]|uniref:hypothetical protein n=1 Tax=Anabaena sp. CCY 9402-a TaxID=3103867 RepID=UPI0039C5CAC9
MILNRPTATWKLLVAFVLSFLLCITLLSGCGQKDKTSVGWNPAAPVGIHLSREAKGLWKISTNIPLPVKELGVFSIAHQFDVRDDYTYIIIRDKKNGTEQVFQLGVNKGKVKLHAIGEHKLTLQPGEDNKIIIDNEAISGTITIEIYPDGQKLASVIFDNGTEFVFLSDNRLHIEYASLVNSIKRERLPDAESLFRSDNFISLASLEKVTFTRDLGISQLKFDWKPEIRENQEPLVIELPKQGKSTISNIEELKNAITTLAPKVQFIIDNSNPKLWFFLVIELIGISLVIGFGMKKKKGCFEVLLYLLGTTSFVIYTLVTLTSDPSYLGF